MKTSHRWIPASGSATMWISGNATYLRSGEVLECWGHAWRINPNRNPGETDFSTVMRHRREHLQIKIGSLDSVKAIGHDPISLIGRLHQHAFDSVQELYEPDVIPLAQALILGNPGALSTQRDKLIGTGTIHLFAVSGLHVGLIAFFAHWTLVVLTGRPRLLMVIAVIWGYAILTGLRPPVMRASVLASAAVFAFNSHKLMQMDNILCAAAITVLICDPSALFQSGTQLSFLAYFIVSRFALIGHKQQRLSGLDRLIVDHQSAPVSAVGSVSRWLRSAARTSLVVWVTTLPFVLTSFQVSSWWSIPLTVCLTPPLIVALLSGLVSIVPLPECLALTATDMSSYALRLINVTTAWCSTLPWSRILSAGTSPAALAALYFCMLTSKTVWSPLLRRISTFLFIFGYVGIIAYTFIPAFTGDASGNKDSLLIRFVSVGHGCCVLMTFPNGKTWMYDAGELGTGKKAAQSIQSVLWHAGISEIDTLFISHMDKDHFNATPHLLKSTTIRRCIVSDATMSLSPKWKELEELLLENGTKVETCSRSAQFNPCDHATVRVLFTGLALKQTNDNARSTVLHLQFGMHSLLLAGDIEGVGLDVLTRQAIKPIDVLLAPHHGSLHSEPERFAAWCRPQFTIATTGRHTLPRRVTDAYTSQQDGRPRTLLSTHRHGFVMVELSQAGIYLEPMYPDGLGS